MLLLRNFHQIPIDPKDLHGMNVNVVPVLRGCLKAEMDWALLHQIHDQPLGLLQAIYLNSPRSHDEDRNSQIEPYHNLEYLVVREEFLLQLAIYHPQYVRL